MKDVGGLKLAKVHELPTKAAMGSWIQYQCAV